MGFALNILALVIVLGLCWFAMVFLTGRFHGHRGIDDPNGFADADVREPASRDFVTGMPMTESPATDLPATDLPATELPVTVPESSDACPACEGIGATNARGRLQPCPRCEGTGVTTPLS